MWSTASVMMLSTSQPPSSSIRAGSFGVKQHAITRACAIFTTSAVERLVVDLHRDALEARKARPSNREAASSSSSARGSAGTASRAAVERLLGKRRQQRRHVRIAPQRRGVERDGGAGFALAPGRRLDLELQ